MKKLLIVSLSLILALSFTACDVFTGGGTTNNNDSKNGNSSTTQPTATGDDTISQNALTGTWHSGADCDYFWHFEKDGSFIYYVYARTRVDAGAAGTINNVYEQLMKGKFRTNGSIIECFDVQVSSHFSAGTSYEYLAADHGDMHDVANKLTQATLKSPERTDNFSLKFEFFDAMRLRLVIERNNKLDNNYYDGDFVYNGNNRNVTIPTHSLPPLEWPADLLPSGTPEYGIGGRVRRVENTNEDDVIIIVDKTTRDECLNYINRLLNAGWENDWRHVSVEEVINGEAMGCFEKDNISLWFSIDENGCVRLNFF